MSCAAALTLCLLPGCESTQSKSAKLARESKGALHQRGVTVRHQNPKVEVLSADAVQDSNGTAVVIAMRNKGKRTLANLPVGIDVKGAHGASLFKNSAPGLAPSLVEVPVLRPGQELLWVNDQVLASSKPRKVDAKVGAEEKRVTRPVPTLAFSGVRLREDPVDGPEASGRVLNRSGVEQRKLVIFGVVRQGKRLVAAGRAQVNRLKAHDNARFNIFFIGNPLQGRLTLSAPPTVLR